MSFYFSLTIIYCSLYNQLFKLTDVYHTISKYYRVCIVLICS